VLNVFQADPFSAKYYLITNLGIFIAHYLNKGNYQLTSFFLETTAGRLIFSNNFLNSIKK
jgi:hypothetical protein